MRLIKRFGAALAATAGLVLAGAGVAAADTDHGHGLIDDITVVAPINVEIVDNALAVLGVAEHDD